MTIATSNAGEVGEQRLLLTKISWETYERLLAELDNRALRLTYDRGALEIMSPSRKHEKLRRMIGRMIDQLTLELGIAIDGGGSTTYRRQLEERGLEPDECYYIANVETMRDVDEVDLDRDPPPDLAIEVEISRSALDRMTIYAALRVPEIWRYDGKTLTVHLLQSDGGYRESSTSASFPFLPIPEVERFLADGLRKDETSFIREFRDWVKKTLVAPG